MSNLNHGIREVGNAIGEFIQGKKVLQYGIIKDVSRKGHEVKVLLLPHSGKEEDTVWIKWKYLQASETSRIGGMPPLESRIFVAYTDNGSDNPYQNAIAFDGVFDDNNVAPAGTADADADRWLYTIKPPNGGSIEFYEKDGTNKIRIESDGEIDVVCNDIKMGTIADVKKLVNEDHLDKFNALIDFFGTVFAPLTTVADPFTATAALIAMNAIWQAGNTATKDTTNKTSDLQAS